MSDQTPEPKPIAGTVTLAFKVRITAAGNLKKLRQTRRKGPNDNHD